MGCRCTSTAAIVRLRIFVLIINAHPEVIGGLHSGTDGPVYILRPDALEGEKMTSGSAARHRHREQPLRWWLRPTQGRLQPAGELAAAMLRSCSPYDTSIRCLTQLTRIAATRKNPVINNAILFTVVPRPTVTSPSPYLHQLVPSGSASKARPAPGAALGRGAWEA